MLQPLSAAVASGDMDGEMRAAGAAAIFWIALIAHEAQTKSPPDVRAPLEESVLQLAKPYFGAIAKEFTAASFAKMIGVILETGILQPGGGEAEDLLIGCGALQTIHLFAVVHPQGLTDSAVVFESAIISFLRQQ